MDKYEALKRYFGYDRFRGGQEKLIDAILQGRDVFGIMPTGGGKSLCFQIPAVLTEGITLVISPLISLMKDQVTTLNSAGIRAAYVNSTLTAKQLTLVYRNISAGMYKIVYVAPERMLTDSFVALAQSLNIPLLAVDEAHCISQWGQDFRPSYLKIVEFLSKLRERPVIAAFTATATPLVREDIARILALRNPVCLLTGFDRPNLYFDVRTPNDKMSYLAAIMERLRGRSGIIYCSTRKGVERVYDYLIASGFPATRYHAGLPDDERRVNQDDFLCDKSPVMVATNAFGMGIDKPNVNFVIHFNMPKSLEAYYQEAGRAGRNGERADCVMLFSPDDVMTAEYFIEQVDQNNELSEAERKIVKQQDLIRLDTIINYCMADDCLRGYILEYFGQKHDKRCRNCSNCLRGNKHADVRSLGQNLCLAVELL